MDMFPAVVFTDLVRNKWHIGMKALDQLWTTKFRWKIFLGWHYRSGVHNFIVLSNNLLGGFSVMQLRRIHFRIDYHWEQMTCLHLTLCRCHTVRFPTFCKFYLLPIPTLIKGHHGIHPKATWLIFLHTIKELDGPNALWRCTFLVTGPEVF